MEAVAVAWIGVGVSALIQITGFAFFFGVMSQKVAGLRRDVDKHEKLPAIHAHAIEHK